MKPELARKADPAPAASKELDLPSGGTAKTMTAIAEQLGSAILAGHYDYGERLPAERDLAAHFKVSRATVREALDQLEKAGLVLRRIGSGTFSNYRTEPEDHSIAERTSPLEVIEVRLAVEPHMVRLAVINASARDIERIERALQELLACGQDKKAFTLADEAFHLALAEASRNPLMVWLYRHLNDVRNHAQWGAMRDVILTPERLDDYNRQHCEIVEAIKSRDADSAVATITSHLVKARRHLMGASSGEA